MTGLLIAAVWVLVWIGNLHVIAAVALTVALVAVGLLIEATEEDDLE